jgi:hypothetical protein
VVRAFKGVFDGRVEISRLTEIERALPEGLYVRVISQKEARRMMKRVVLE